MPRHILTHDVSLPVLIGLLTTAAVLCAATFTARGAAAEGLKPAKAAAAAKKPPPDPWKARKYSSEYLKDAVAFYDQGHYDRAESFLSQAERDPKLTQEDRLLVLKYQAFIFLMTGRDSHAKVKVDTIYLISPGFALPETDLPTFKKFFAKQKPAAAAKPASPPEPQPDPAALIRQAKASYDSGEYDVALGQFDKAGQQPGVDREGRITALKYQAFILIMTNRKDEARGKVEAIYDLDEGFTLAVADLSTFKTFFAGVKKSYVAKVKPASPPVTAAPAAAPKANDGGPAGVRKTAPAAARPNLFVRFWPSWTCLIAGAGALGPGVYLGLTSTDDRAALKNAPKDANGRLVGISTADMQKMQDDAHAKALEANILMGVGGAAIATGVLMFFLYDGAGPAGAPPVALKAGDKGGAIALSLSF